MCTPRFTMSERPFFSDQTGKLPKRLLRGNKYIMVLVEIDSNTIVVAPMKSRHDDEMKRAYKSMLTRLHRSGIVHKKHVLDNKVSASMKAMIRDEFHIKIEFVLPGRHRQHATEVSIINFKAHFLGRGSSPYFAIFLNPTSVLYFLRYRSSRCLKIA